MIWDAGTGLDGRVGPGHSGLPVRPTANRGIRALVSQRSGLAVKRAVAVTSAILACLSSCQCGSTSNESTGGTSVPDESRPGAGASDPQPESTPSGCCRTREELDAAYGSRVRVVGTYRVVPIHSKGGRDLIARWPAVVLADGTEVLLESFWNHVDGRSPREREELVGRRVAARGVLRREPPRQEGMQNLLAPTLAPVDHVRPVDAE